MKINELRKIMKSKNIDLALFMNYSNSKKDPAIKYFTGVDLEFSCLIVPREKKPFMVITDFEIERVKKESLVAVMGVGKNKISDIIRKKIKRFKNIGINKNFVSINEYSAIKKAFKCRFVDLSKEISDLRVTKTSEEIVRIKTACGFGDIAFKKTILNFHKFKTELDVANFMDETIRSLGCVPSFETIIASGKNAANPHHVPSSAILNNGFCVMDFGVKFKNYCSDMTRTIYIGDPSKNEVKIYWKVLNLQLAAINNINVGQDSILEYNKIKKILGKEFNHGLGHGIGIEVHEFPSLSSKNGSRLLENMVFSIEPGFYKKNKMGIRIEDTVVLTKKGIIPLTKISKNLLIIKK